MLSIFCGCGNKDVAAPNPGQYVPAQGKLKFLALGDSYTCGENVAVLDWWPVQLAAVLRDKGIDVGDPGIVARTGWSTNELLTGMDGYKLSSDYDLVSLQIGVNNEFRHQDYDDFKHQFKELLDRSIALAGGRPKRVIVLSIPDWTITPWGRSLHRDDESKEIDRFNAYEKDQVTQTGAVWVNVTDVSDQMGTDSTMVAHDGLLPSGKLYTQWASLTAPAAQDALAGK